ncbi:glutathione S-transferase family protein [Bradyrhizobium sp. G127]|jgi:glutathione S-transferase|uniref:glutathione S-transferase family protein n=1 Tax=Bradyrhizobium sp. G127 TaxID=2904800 RepID=UPI001F351F27|nr:glutathione S-transferase family protein [Bradyrhizobium sp. G127]MCF2524825.1 glutathione S-transferase family protein [Bradyrhizobium sp. G127]
MADELILWGAGTSRTIRAHWALHELDLSYTSRPILPRSGETKTAEYTALNPRQKIPLLQDGDLTIGESAAIVAYLANKHQRSDCALVPDCPKLYAKWLEWCFFIVTELDSTSLYVMRRHGTNKGLAHIYGEAPQVVTKAGEYFREQLRHVDVALSDGRKYLMGSQFTTADILLATCLTWAIDYGVGICDSAAPYLERVTSRAGYRAGETANFAEI